MSIVMGGQRYEFPLCESYVDEVHIPEEYERNGRKQPVSKVIVHSSGEHAPSGEVLESYGPGGYHRWLANYLQRKQHSSAHFMVGYDGMIAQVLDPVRWVAWHASDTQVNEQSVGIELLQRRTGEFYEQTLLSAQALILYLILYFQIQAQIAVNANGDPFLGKIQRLGTDPSSLYGVFAHQQVPASNHADPGFPIFRELLKQGYEGFQFNQNQDLAVWSERQRWLGVSPQDGVPGPKTVQALEAHGYEYGLWKFPPSFWRRNKRALWVFGGAGLVGLGTGLMLKHKRIF